MQLDILPFRTASAAENMAMDFLLLRRYPQPHARFRHYEWHRPAFTFGYSQKIAFVREQLAEQTDESLDLCRRPTGGGIVDHREDWTYSLIIPRGHALEEARAADSYREIHVALAAALQKQGVAAEVQTECEPPEEGKSCGLSGVCFQRAERFDVVHSGSGAKIAGAAQKRNKNGLLFQGSLWRPAVQAQIDWATLEEDFIQDLAKSLECETVYTPWPEFAEGEIDGLIEQYSSTEWLEYR
jgi:lipoyl(octanoyl) transferase